MVNLAFRQNSKMKGVQVQSQTWSTNIKKIKEIFKKMRTEEVVASYLVYSVSYLPQRTGLMISDADPDPSTAGKVATGRVCK